MATPAGVLEDYEKDIVSRAELTMRDLQFLEPEEIAGELKHRITVERAAEIRAHLNLTTLKGLTLPTAKVLHAAGISNQYTFLEMKPEDVLAQVNARREEDGAKPWGDKELRKVAKIIESNQDVLDEW